MPDCHNGQAPERPTDDQDDPTQAPAVSSSPVRQFFSVPTPIKRIFDRFPLVIYPPNELPTRLTPHAKCNRLFVFLDIAGARQGKPSFNPQCLRWQVR
jgi:metaxin